jgi:hypothetical protein
MSDIELNRELKGLQTDREMYKNELKRQQENYAHFLRNELGEDIDNVLNGKVKVKLSFKERFKYFINKIFNTF